MKQTMGGYMLANQYTLCYILNDLLTIFDNVLHFATKQTSAFLVETLHFGNFSSSFLSYFFSFYNPTSFFFF